MNTLTTRPSRIRWLILALLFFISVVTYIDRVNISVTARQMMPAYGMTDQQMGWVFSAFGAHQPLNAVSPKILRALLHRSYDLVRHDIPRQTVEADFDMLERAIKSDTEFAKLFGITTVSKPSSNSANYPYTLGLVAEKVTGKEGVYWYEAQKYIDRIKVEKKVDIKRSDNRYHSATKTGKKRAPSYTNILTIWSS